MSEWLKNHARSDVSQSSISLFFRKIARDNKVSTKLKDISQTRPEPVDRNLVHVGKDVGVRRRVGDLEQPETDRAGEATTGPKVQNLIGQRPEKGVMVFVEVEIYEKQHNKVVSRKPNWRRHKPDMSIQQKWWAVSCCTIPWKSKRHFQVWLVLCFKPLLNKKTESNSEPQNFESTKPPSCTPLRHPPRGTVQVLQRGAIVVFHRHFVGGLNQKLIVHAWSAHVASRWHSWSDKIHQQLEKMGHL